MNRTDRVLLYEKVLSYNGMMVQLNKCKEELFELGVALCHYSTGKVMKESLTEEIADVEIMLEQLSHYFMLNVEEIRELKLKRLSKMINGV